MLAHEEPLSAAARPSRLSLLAQIVIPVLLFLSVISGALIWWGQSRQLEELQTPGWLRACVVLHGTLNPFICVLFGYLLSQHIRMGWELKANRPSGFILEALLGGLIASGAGLYYAGSDEWRTIFVWGHRLLGVALPVGLLFHWVLARAWVKKLPK